MKLLSLQALSNTRDRAEARAAAGRSQATDPIREFSTRIACELAMTPTLRYSRRLALLQRARRAGINRFDANLMIAAVQHRAPAQIMSRPPRESSLMLTLGAFAFIQSTILLGAWFVFAR